MLPTMDESPSPATSTDSSKPESTLAKLQREAENSNDIPLHPTYGSRSGDKLRAWREAAVEHEWTPRKELTDVNMDDIFPSIDGPSGPSKPKLNRWQAHQVRQIKSKRKRAKSAKAANADSSMGLFDLLPGELRNYIYRLAFVPDKQPVVVAGSDLVCGRGACVHKRASMAAPAIASTCQQIRNELMPIFCAENAFRFDAVMVRNRCAWSWVKTINTYARLIKKVVLEILVLNRNWLAGGTDSQLCEISIECPAGRSDGKFEMSFDAKLPQEKVDECGLKALVQRLNDGESGWASKLAWIVGSDELAELVYRCKK